MISVNASTYVIFVPQSDLTSLGGGKYELDVNWLRLQLRDFEDSVDGISMPITHNHNTAVTLSGVTYARVVEILSPYTIEFEDGIYQVACVGANHNILDVKVVNSVSLIIGNSAGLIQITSGSGLSSDQATQLAELYKHFGLKAGTPLVISPTARVAGDVELAIAEAGGTVTVTRQ